MALLGKGIVLAVCVFVLVILRVFKDQLISFSLILSISLLRIAVSTASSTIALICLLVITFKTLSISP